MAFVVKSERNLDFARKDLKNIGPGMYVGHKQYNVKPTSFYAGMRLFNQT